MKAAKVVLNILLIKAIQLDEVDSHAFAPESLLPELVEAISVGNLAGYQRTGEGSAIAVAPRGRLEEGPGGVTML